MWDLEPAEDAVQPISPWPDNNVLTSQQKREFLEKVAQALARRHLATPALLLVGSLAPIRIISGQALLVLRPLLSLVLSSIEQQAIFSLLEERQQLEQFQELLEFHRDYAGQDNVSVK